MSCALPTLLVSMCFLKGNCKWDGGDNISPEIKEFLTNYNTLVVCPEMFGGLGCPRRPCEIRTVDGERCVFNDAGEEVTLEFYQGAEKALHLARMAGAKYALLKANSPSCGSGKIYDGTFTSTLVEGDGVFAQMLKENGFKVFNEFELQALKQELEQK